MSSKIEAAEQLSGGGRVFWDVTGTSETPHLVEGEILSLDSSTAVVLPIQRWYRDGQGHRTEPIFEAKAYPFRRSYFERSLEQRLHETSAFWATACQ